MRKISEIEVNMLEEIDVNGVKVKQYLPIEKKLALAGNIVNNTADDTDFYNPARLEIFYVLNMVRAYTDIEYEDMDIFEAYDRLVGSGFWQGIDNAIPFSEKDFIKRNVEKVIENVYAYKNSALGMIRAIGEEAKNLEIDGQKIKETIGSPEVMKFTKDVLDKLG